LQFGYRNPDIVTMMNESMYAVNGCYNKGEFNFWHEVYWPESIATKYPAEDNIPRRNPNHYNLKNKWFSNTSNIANDADDSANGYLAIYFNNLINNELNQKAFFEIPEKIGPYFERFVDSNRKNVHIYDLIHLR